ncbi:hypothetical protein [Microbacterium sp. SORGH_AS_0888]|uniref:hypothetical protein n=1 Tax=Microbacterium sp. SORGH_AS_0888 TaxID=3041791 RepID=UPI0027816A71|nr:hypothetical protein [Microbacterium sp. SORGH_AS_0888]MDQ1131308.1 hypothetical protein [Microbacterium sp. SORGH_AS_0888]
MRELRPAAGVGFAADVRVDTDQEWGRFAPSSAERAALAALGDGLGVRIRPARLRLADGSRVEIDGASEDGAVVVQLPLRGGEFTSQHRNKIMADMFKLSWLREHAAPGARCVLCVRENARGAFRGGGWLARAATDSGIEVIEWDDAGLRTLVPDRRG